MAGHRALGEGCVSGGIVRERISSGNAAPLTARWEGQAAGVPAIGRGWD
jgi:hypothetical protein